MGLYINFNIVHNNYVFSMGLPVLAFNDDAISFVCHKDQMCLEYTDKHFLFIS